MAIALTLGLIAWIEQPDSYGVDDLVVLVVRQIGLGLVVGVALGAVAMWVVRADPGVDRRVRPRRLARGRRAVLRRRDTIGGSGFLAVYLVGLAVGSTPSRYRREVAAFHEGLAFVAQVVALRAARPARVPATTSRPWRSPGSRSRSC